MRYAIALIASLLLAAPVWACPAGTVVATASAQVVEGLTITRENPLNFGFVTPSATGGTVTVSPDGKRSQSGDVTASSSFAAAVFNVQGIPGHDYTIQAPSTLTFSVQDAPESATLVHDLTVTHFVTYSTTASANTANGRLNPSGQDKIYLGATLIVPANAAPGVYSGLVPVTVSY